MRFSVLLPTRNRLDLLRYAVESVTRQDYADWELVISDNFSEQDVEGYVRSLNEPRIRYYRTGSFVSVTENWNNAIEKSAGDYAVMLGDDDCLMKGYFTTLRRLIETHGEADFVYTSALLYAYPGVMPGFPDGFLQHYGYAEFLKSAREPFWLDRAAALRLVRNSMNFRVSFGFNMQFALIGRGLIDVVKRKGTFFQSPYPDYYAMNAILLAAKRILVCPYPLVTIGISPKSFGYYYFNQSERQGTEFLKNLPDPEMSQRLEHVVLPGTDMNTSWLIAMETLRLNYGSEFGLRVNYNRYRLLQIAQVHAQFGMDAASARNALRQLRNKTRLREKSLSIFLRVIAAALRPVPAGLRRRIINGLLALTGTYPRYHPEKVRGRYRNILEVHERIDPQASLIAPAET